MRRTECQRGGRLYARFARLVPVCVIRLGLALAFGLALGAAAQTLPAGAGAAAAGGTGGTVAGGDEASALGGAVDAAAGGTADVAPGGDTSAETAVAAAIDVVRSLHAALVATANDAALTTREERYDALAPTIRATHDLPYIAEITIRRQWRGLDADARHRFVAAFSRLSIMTYATRFAGVGPDAFEILGAEPAGDGRIEVRAAIARADAEDVPLDYVLEQRDGAWKIVNIIADGVSDLALKRAQYQGVLAGGGSISDLVDLLEDETDKL